MRKHISTALAAFVLSGCAAKVNPFESSDEAMMAEVIQKANFSEDLSKLLLRSKGQKMILVNLEDSDYINDQLPEYMIHDAIYERLTKEYVGIELLERDDDLIRIIEQENDGISFCPTKQCEAGEATSDESLSLEERRAQVANLIRKITEELSKQDVVVMNEEECCSAGGKKTKGSLETMIVANEIGKEKGELLEKLVKDYISLYQLEKEDKPKKKEKAKLSLDLPQADLLFSYRVYDYGTWVQTQRKTSRRITYIKLHIRVVDMKTGEVVLSDFMEETINDTMTTKERAALSRSKASQSDYGRPAKGKKKKKANKSSDSSSSSKGLLNKFKK